MDDYLAHLIATDGVIAAAEHRAHRQRIRTAHAAGELVRLLPGIYAPADDFHHRLMAANAWDPNCVIGGAAAAKVLWWEELSVREVDVASLRRASPARGFRFSRTKTADELIVDRNALRLAHPALSVIQMIPEQGPEVIDQALRRKAVRIGDLFGALKLMPHRDGNAQAARWVLDSRDEPWSELEREAHARLRAAGITGWKSNHPVRCKNRTAFLDVGFPGLKLGLEFDGWEYHRDFASFVDDRSRDVDLTLEGWRILRFTAPTMDDVVPATTAMLRMLS